MNDSLLKFGFEGNAKLAKSIVTFSLPAGHTCPGAHECLAKVNRETGKLSDGESQQFRCFSASQEAVFPIVRKNRWHNFDLLKGKSTQEMVELIEKSLFIGKPVSMVRIHVSGDFFNRQYFLAWIAIARKNPSVVFYAYTKSLNFWVEQKENLPSNFILTASNGGKHNLLISKHKLRQAIVVNSKKDAEKLKLEIDNDDSHAYTPGNRSFALLLHGNGKVGSLQAKLHSDKCKAKAKASKLVNA